MKVIEITESKMNKLSSLVEDMLIAGGELMHCLSKMEDDLYGERSQEGYDRYEPMRENRMRDDRMYGERMYGERRRRYMR